MRNARSFTGKIVATIAASLLCCIVPCARAIAQDSTASSLQSNPQRMSPTEQAAATELFQDANRFRASHRLPSLRNDPALTKAALLHARRMVAAGKLSHRLPGEPNLVSRIQKVGIHGTTFAENIASGPNAARISDQWEHSASHRANLLDPRVNAVGTAVIETHGGLFAVQDFAREVAGFSRSGQEREVASLLEADGFRVIGNHAVARASCSGTVTHHRPRPRLVVRYTTADLAQLPEKVQEALDSGRYHRAAVGACGATKRNGFLEYSMAILLY